MTDLGMRSDQDTPTPPAPPKPTNQIQRATLTLDFWEAGVFTRATTAGPASTAPGSCGRTMRWRGGSPGLWTRLSRSSGTPLRRHAMPEPRMDSNRDTPEDDERIIFFGGPPGTKVTARDSAGRSIKTVQIPDDEFDMGERPLRVRVPPPKRSRRERILTKSMRFLKGRRDG